MAQVIIVSTTIPVMFTSLLRITLHLRVVQSNRPSELLEFNHPRMDPVKRLLQTGKTLSKKLLISTIIVLLESDLAVF
jgi:hypothetical protein